MFFFSFCYFKKKKHYFFRRYSFQFFFSSSPQQEPEEDKHQCEFVSNNEIEKRDYFLFIFSFFFFLIWFNFLFFSFFLFIHFVFEFYFIAERKKWRNLPTTSRSPLDIPVWNDGASAETSQLYFPEAVGWTLLSVTWLSFDIDRYTEQEEKKKKIWK